VKSFKINTTQRSDIVAKSMKDLPGPGSYDSHAKIGKGGPSFSMNKTES
jgi:hypothetical protein